jgi:hypothetical protein
MNCKNCQEPLGESHSFCAHCGAKVIRHRLTLRQILKDFGENVLGWDNKYFRTIRGMIKEPDVLLKAYFSGTRKRYMHPLTFMTIGMALSIFVYSIYDEQYLELTAGLSDSYAEANPDQNQEVFDQKEFNRTIQAFMLKYMNLVTYLMLPLFSFMTWIIFRKPYNFSEHLVANAYTQGITFLATTFFFLLTVWVDPRFYWVASLFTIIAYTYVFARLYRLGVWKMIFKLLLFALVLGVIFIIAMVIGVAYMIISGAIPIPEQ